MQRPEEHDEPDEEEEERELEEDWDYDDDTADVPPLETVQAVLADACALARGARDPDAQLVQPLLDHERDGCGGEGTD